MTSRTYRALLVANSTFPNDPHNLPDLEGPRNDPALLRDALCDRDAGLVPSDNVRLVAERTMSEVLREVEDFLRTASRQDTLILYYSGHGVLDQSSELFLCTRDTRTDRLRSTAVKASDVREMIEESAAATTVIVLDCCHSGRFKGGDVPAALAGRGRFVMASSRSGELANDTNRQNHASLFTHHLVVGLVEGAEDRDGDGVVNLSDLYEYVHAALAREGKQVPQKRFEGDGDVPIARRAGPTDQLELGLVHPEQVAPELDVPDTSIDLGEVDGDVDLPPERVAVVNRGGGTLAWTVESSADWVTAVADEGDVVLHLAPRPGPNRANVYIRDARTGAIKTVRIAVRVRAVAAPAEAPPAVRLAPPPEAPVVVAEPPPPATEPAEDLVPREAPVVEPESPPVAEPVEDQAPPDAPADEAEDPVPPVVPVAKDEPAGAAEPAPPHPSTLVRWAPVVAGIVALLAGLLIMLSGTQAVDVVHSDTGFWIWLRNRNGPGPGLLPRILAGGVLWLAGVGVLVRPARRFALGAAMVIAFSVGFDQLGTFDSSNADAACQCFGSEDVFAFPEAGLLCLIAGALCAAALAVRHEWARRRWLPRWALVVGVLGGAWWGLTTTGDMYAYYDDPFGASTGWGGTGWYVLAFLAVVAGVIAAWWLVPRAGAGALAGAAVLPVLATAADVAWALGHAGEDGYDVRGVVLPVLGAVALVVVAAVGARRARRVRSHGRVDEPEQAALAAASDEAASS